MVNDCYSNVIPPLLPLLQQTLRADLRAVGLHHDGVHDHVERHPARLRLHRGPARETVADRVQRAVDLVLHVHGGRRQLPRPRQQQRLHRHPRDGRAGRVRVVGLPPPGVVHGAPHQRRSQRRRHVHLLGRRQPRLRDHAAAGRAGGAASGDWAAPSCCSCPA